MSGGNTSEIVEFIRDRSFAQLDSLLTLVIPAVFVYLTTRFGIKTVLIKKSLRLRLILVSLILLSLSFVALYFGVNPAVIIIGTVFGQIAISFYALRSLADVGLLNAFQTTRDGLSAGASLKLANKSISFLGIGAKKLIDDDEFDAAIRRVKDSGGNLQFLLSSPDNPALEDIARRNNRYNTAYKSRVRESISEIHNRTKMLGVRCEIRIYSLSNRIALPHFRLMFIDDEICLFSQLVWNDSEGLDNPQLIVRRKPTSQASSLYIGYKSYFDDLWAASTSVVVDDALIASWPH